ncbi:DUF4198 domain-containing protein [Desertibacillus haloalkaliphilus]|uniref:DUF4198 domain-containing protein n=1 Tax=Desertibacillus haloalkaliphilus TaxID=1328930 RepID=UPI001C25348B|nr:DUF4198 domain-containing protein [Desertibacillus haloalkaliphilus]MBU8906363.1 DUF4198 domain-containing protein [Desertibacillus haloalkaliphilus]
MKKKLNLRIFVLVMIFLFTLVPKGFAHELFIVVDEEVGSEELEVDVLWGHLRDFVDNTDLEDYQLHVKHPNGKIESLELEAVGVHARSFVSPPEEGSYVFWATRTPRPYSPDDETTILSNHMAKTIYQVGEGNGSPSITENLTLEINPEVDLTSFTTGTFTAQVMYDGEVAANAIVSAYGPSGEILEETTDEDGMFLFEIETEGQWLFKATVDMDEAGEVNGEEYESISNTTTLIIDNTSGGEAQLNIDQPPYTLTFITLFIGLLLGSAITMLVAMRKRNH